MLMKLGPIAFSFENLVDTSELTHSLLLSFKLLWKLFSLVEQLTISIEFDVGLCTLCVVTWTDAFNVLG